MSLIFDIEEIPEDHPLVLNLKEPPDLFSMDSTEGSLCREVVLKGTLTRTGREIFLSGTLSTEMTLECSRCLEPFQMPVSSNISACYIPAAGSPDLEPELELNESDIDLEYYSDQTIDLTQPVYDQILLSLPMVRLCREDCRGLCPQCGASLNRETCGCRPEAERDPRLEVLKQLKDEMK